jgi:hypothetical protein
MTSIEKGLLVLATERVITKKFGSTRSRGYGVFEYSCIGSDDSVWTQSIPCFEERIEIIEAATVVIHKHPEYRPLISMKHDKGSYREALEILSIDSLRDKREKIVRANKAKFAKQEREEAIRINTQEYKRASAKKGRKGS